MVVFNPIAGTQPLLVASARSVAVQLQVGQILQALVLAGTSGGRVTLDLGGQRLMAATELPLRQGQAIDVQVERARNPVVLKVLPEARGEVEVERRALRAALPRQAPLTPLMANLRLLADGATTAPRPSLPAPAAAAVGQIVRALPTPAQVTTAPGLREAVRTSGTFFEAALAQAATGTANGPGRDLKAHLVRLLAILSRPPASTASSRPAGPLPDTAPGTPASRPAATPAQPAEPPASRSGTPRPPGANPDAASGPTRQVQAPPTEHASPPMRGRPPAPQSPAPPTLSSNMPPSQVATELRQQVEGALSRIQVHQLNSLPLDEGNRAAWSMEIPVRREDGTDVLGLRISREPAEPPGGAASEASWTVELSLDLAGLGPLSSRLTLRGGQVSAVLWAEEPAAVRTIQSHLTELDEALAAAGIEVARLGIFAGPPPRASTAQTALSHLLNVSA